MAHHTNAEKVEETKEERKAPLVYMGPTLRSKILLTTGTIIYQGKIDGLLKQHKGLTETLFVEPKKVPEFRRKRMDKNSEEFKAYKTILKEEAEIAKQKKGGK